MRTPTLTGEHQPCPRAVACGHNRNCHVPRCTQARILHAYVSTFIHQLGKPRRESEGSRDRGGVPVCSRVAFWSWPVGVSTAQTPSLQGLRRRPVQL